MRIPNHYFRPLVDIGMLGCIAPNFYIEKIGQNCSIPSLPMSAMLGTANILRKILFRQMIMMLMTMDRGKMNSGLR